MDRKKMLNKAKNIILRRNRTLVIYPKPLQVIWTKIYVKQT